MRRINDQRVKRLHAEGLSMGEISRKMHCSPRAVRNSLDRQGLQSNFASGENRPATRELHRKRFLHNNPGRDRWRRGRVEALSRWPGGAVTAGQAAVLDALETAGSLTTRQLAETTGVEYTGSAIQRHLRNMLNIGFVSYSLAPLEKAGRPVRLWSLAGAALEAASRRKQMADLD